MKFEYDKEMLERLVQGLRERRERFTDEKIHASSLTRCLKRAYFRMKKVEPDFSIDRLLRFTIGRSHHEILQNLGLAEIEVNGEGDLARIVCHIDILIDGYPLELKSTRMRITDKTKVPEHYIKQLGYECVLSGKSIGYLGILWIIPPDLSVYKIEFQEDELKALRNEMIERRDMLVAALQEGPESLNGTGQLWECAACEYLSKCKTP